MIHWYLNNLVNLTPTSYLHCGLLVWGYDDGGDAHTFSCICIL